MCETVGLRDDPSELIIDNISGETVGQWNCGTVEQTDSRHQAADVTTASLLIDTNIMSSTEHYGATEIRS